MASRKKSWIVGGLSVAIAALGMSAATSRPPQAAATQPCFAYILDGDVWLRCNGQASRVTTQGDITDFAVSEDTVAWERGREEGDIESFPLNGEPGPYLDPRGGPSRLYASCGTILHVRYGYDERGFPSGAAVAVLEVPGAKAFGIDSYLDFRCSSDRKVVLGLTTNGRTFAQGVPPRYAGGDPKRFPYYAVSPNGRYSARGGPAEVCVQPRDGFSICLGDQDSDGISVSDEGSILYTGTWDEHTCSYKDAWHASLEPRPGYTERDLCQAVVMWHRGLDKPEILVPLAREPQWISGKTAGRLAAWRTQQPPAGAQ